MLHMLIGGAGCGKSTALAQAVRTAAESKKAVRTLVPEQFAFTYDKRLYQVLGAAGFNQICTGSFRSLTAEILDACETHARDAADDVCKTVVLHRILRSRAEHKTLEFYGRHADKPAFLAQMQAQLTELMQSGALPEQLAEAAESTPAALSAKLHDIAGIYADYLRELEARGMRDAQRDPLTAADFADHRGFLRGCTCFLDEFESFTGDQYRMLAVMLRDADDVWIALRTDDIDAPEYSRFDAAAQTARRLRKIAKRCGCAVEVRTLTEQHRFADPSLSYLSRNLYTKQENENGYQGIPAVTVAEARDITLEAEYTAAQIRRLLMEDGVRCSEIMVVMHDLSEYGPLLETAFRRYEIPYFMDLRRSVLHTAVMKLPVCLLSLLSRTTAEQVLLLMKTQLSPLSQSETAMLENFAYTWDIEGEQWEKPFVAEMDPNGVYEQMRQKLLEPILKRRRLCRGKDGSPVSGDVLCTVLYACMDEMKVPMRVGGLAERLKAQGDLAAGRALRRLWNHFTELLDALHDALTELPMTTRQLAELMTAVLRGSSIPVPPQTLDAVTVQSAAAARYDDPKIVFVLGVNDGLFPAEITQGGFFTETERDVLEQKGLTLSRSVRDLCADERLIVYKTLSAASAQLWLSYPIADESGKPRKPSALIGEVRSLLPLLQITQAAELGADFYVSTRAAAYYSFTGDYTVTPAERSAVREMLRQIPQERPRLERLSRSSDPERLRVTDKALMHRLNGDTIRMSATQIETSITCPFKGFCKGGLRLNLREKRNLNPLSGGNLVHFCMERLFLEHPDKADFLAMDRAALQAHADRCAEDFLISQLGGNAGRAERMLSNYRRLTPRIVRLLLHTQEELRQSAFAPDACELVIGRLGDETGTAPFRLSLKNGMTLILNGKIDRVDVCEQDGRQYLRILDYKTGEKRFLLANVLYGLNLQMLLYLFALLDDPTYYPDALPAGVLYVPSGQPKPSRDRDSAESAAEFLQHYFCMSGTVLLDRGILSKMEAEIAGLYIPAALEKSDPGTGEPLLTKDSSVFTPQQLRNLRRYVEDTLRACAEDYAEGEVAPHPMQGASGEYYADACFRCDYRSICGIGADPGASARKPMQAKDAAAKMLAIMNGEEAPDNAAMDN